MNSAACASFTFLCLCTLMVHCSPPSPPSPPPSAVPPLPVWLAIERVLPSPGGEGDAVLVRPDQCQRPCADLLGDGAAQIARARCVCRCPPAEPVFVQARDGTGKSVSDCPGRTIRFDRDIARSEFAPALSLPRTGEPLAEELRIAWKDSGVKVRPGQGPRCAIQSAAVLGNANAWRPLDGDLFTLGWAAEDGRVIWTGNDRDAEALAGGIVQIALDCTAGKSGNASYCLAFRVEGQIESLRSGNGSGSAAVGVEVDRGRRAEVVVIIFLAILLFLSLFGSLFLWNVCWRMHKRKLVHSLQMQFLHYAKQEKDKAIADCQLRYQALVKAAAAGVSNGELPHISAANGFTTGNGGVQQQQQSAMVMMVREAGEGQAPGGGRRKLYFSAEFFEPHLMTNPPPMAEQFLYDLRKMIAVARERIRTRRHVPRLHAIVESEDEGTLSGGRQIAPTKAEEEQQTPSKVEVFECSADMDEEARSADSGRGDSERREGEEEEPPKQEEEATATECIHLEKETQMDAAQAQLVVHAPVVQKQSATVVPAPSRIPIGTASTSSKSPRLQLKLTAAQQRVPPPLPPRPPPSPPKENGQQQRTTSIAGLFSLSAAKRRISNGTKPSNAESINADSSAGLAVCPPPSYASDHIKKSLPRRKKNNSMLPTKFSPQSTIGVKQLTAV